MINKNELLISVGMDSERLFTNSMYGGALVSIDKKTYEAEYLAFPGEGLPEDFIYSKSFIRENNILYFLDKHGKLIKYNLDTHGYDSFLVSDACCQEVDIFYTDMIKVNDEIFVFQKYSDALKVINIRTKSTEDVHLLNEGERPEAGEVIPSPVFCGSLIEGKKVSLITRDGSFLVTYDCLTRGRLATKISEDSVDVVHMDYRNGLFYMLARNGNIYTVSNKGTRELFFQNETKEACEYRVMIVTDKSIWLFPGVGEAIAIIDIVKKSMKMYQGTPDDIEYFLIARKQSKYLLYTEDKVEDVVYFANPTCVYMMRLNRKTNELTWSRPIFKNHSKKLRHSMKQNEIIKEGEFVLTDFLGIV